MAPAPEATSLFKGDLVAIGAVRCRCGRSGWGEEEHGTRATVGVVRRGLYAIRRAPAPGLADPTVAVVFGTGESYRVRHPLDGGDETLALAFRADLHEEALGDLKGRLLRVEPAAQLAAARLAGAGGEPFATEEAALGLLARIAGSPPTGDPAPIARRRADEVRVLLAAEPARTWRLADVARAVGGSPFHLARQFRAATGETISRHLLRLRLALALERVAEGEEDLARLAADLGFAHHSHFSARFRALYGVTPSQARARP